MIGQKDFVGTSDSLRSNEMSVKLPPSNFTYNERSISDGPFPCFFFVKYIKPAQDVGMSAVALWDYQAEEEDEITFDPGEIISHIEMIDEVIQKNNLMILIFRNIS